MTDYPAQPSSISTEMIISNDKLELAIVHKYNAQSRLKKTKTIFWRPKGKKNWSRAEIISSRSHKKIMKKAFQMLKTSQKELVTFS